MSRWHHFLLGGIVTLAVTAGAALLSVSPPWRSLPEGMALMRLSFTHGSERVCRERTAEELADLPPNMRRTEVCERRRPPVVVELDLDGTPFFRADLPPGGLSGDGPSRVYERFTLPAGPHTIAVRLRDTTRADGFDHSASHTVVLAPEQSFVIDFRADAGGFVFQ